MYFGSRAVICDVGVAVCTAHCDGAGIVGHCDVDVAGAVGWVIPTASPPIVSDALLKMDSS